MTLTVYWREERARHTGHIVLVWKAIIGYPERRLKFCSHVDYMGKSMELNIGDLANTHVIEAAFNARYKCKRCFEKWTDAVYEDSTLVPRHKVKVL